jgi:hypothetical protein
MRWAAVRAFCVAAVASSTLLVTPLARACVEPTLDAWPENPGPGDQVNFWLTNLRDGAQYSVKVNEIEVVPQTIAHGTAPVRGSFTMPDMGASSAEVSVQATVVDTDIAGGSAPTPPDNITYRIPSGPPPPAGNQEPTPERGASSPTGTQTPGGTGGSHHGPAGRGPDRPPSAPKPTGPQPSSPEVSGTQPVEHGVADSTAGAEEAAVAAPTTERPASVARPAERKRAQSPVRRGGGVAGPPMPSTRARSVATDGTARVETVRDGLPPAAVIALGVLVVAGLAGGGWAFVRARLRGPTPEPEAAADVAAPPEVELLDLDAELERLVASEVVTVDLEAELQRMIAEGQQPAEEAGLPASGAASSSG